MRRLLRPYLLAVAIPVWLIATVAGMAQLVGYAQKPGDTGNTPLTWSAADAITRTAGRPTLVLALHPACTCSKATLEQVDHLTTTYPGVFDVVVLLANYDGLPAGADVMGPELKARPQIRRIDDRGAAVAARFGALTSGHALLYDEAGRLRFSGGLTRGRGERGDSASLAYLRAWAAGPRQDGVARFGVFGCALAAHRAPS